MHSSWNNEYNRTTYLFFETAAGNISFIVKALRMYVYFLCTGVPLQKCVSLEIRDTYTETVQ